ncbi:hypothetical protein, partial [Bacillus cereus group sp. BceL180]|uniref:hypothetical protein n=1 Tax=Bacillus cereus group sp. BceL180 TaxID=3445049 RepID=UPI003F268F34
GTIHNLFHKKCFVLLKGGCGNNRLFIQNKIKLLYKINYGWSLKKVIGYTHIFITKVTNSGYKEGTIILYEIYSRVVTKKVVFLLEGSFFY